MKIRHALVALTLATLLTGCAATGNVAPSGFKQQLAYAEATHTAVLEATDSSLNAGTISSVAAGNISASADKANLLLTAAKTAYAAGDVAGANSKLTEALTALQLLQDYLRTQGATK